MDYFIAICGFLGAWLLVAGPLLQGALELLEQEIDREKFDAATHAVAQPPRASRWWWLFPPVAFYRARQRNSAYREAVMKALPLEQREQSIAFLNKATGWFTVAGGASLLAVKETWELVEQFEWPNWLFWVIFVVVFVLCVVNVVVRVNTSNKILEIEPRQRGAQKSGSSDRRS